MEARDKCPAKSDMLEHSLFSTCVRLVCAVLLQLNWEEIN